jgi:hypothetical protein
LNETPRKKRTPVVARPVTVRLEVRLGMGRRGQSSRRPGEAALPLQQLCFDRVAVHVSVRYVL